MRNISFSFTHCSSSLIKLSFLLFTTLSVLSCGEDGDNQSINEEILSGRAELTNSESNLDKITSSDTTTSAVSKVSNSCEDIQQQIKENCGRSTEGCKSTELYVSAMEDSTNGVLLTSPNRFADILLRLSFNEKVTALGFDCGSGGNYILVKVRGECGYVRKDALANSNQYTGESEGEADIGAGKESCNIVSKG